MRLEAGIYAELVAAAIVSDRVYPSHLPQGVTLPAISYNRVSTVQGSLLDGVDTLTRVAIQFDVWADTMAESQAAADAIRAALNGFQGSLSGVTVQYCQLTGENDASVIDGDFERNRISQDFEFTLHE